MHPLPILLSAAGLLGLSTQHTHDEQPQIPSNQQSRPNIVWVLIENVGPELSVYGHPEVHTPHMDELASQGILYNQAYTNAPVCSPSRSSLITGMYPNAIGVHQHRSFTDLPDSILTLPELFRQAGYFTSLGNGFQGKTDYNFRTNDRTLWDGNDWSLREEDQPFFAQLTLNQSHRGMHWHNPYDQNSWMHDYYRERLRPVNPTRVVMPSILPDNLIIRSDWAKYLNQIQVVDYLVGTIVDRLKEEEIFEQTLIVVMGDNGRDALRNEYWLYDGGNHVPLIIRLPEQTLPALAEPGSVTDDLVSGVDISATLLHLAGIPLPSYLQGTPFLGPDAHRRDAIFSSRDRIDDAYDMIRSVRTDRFRYIRNFMPDRPYTQHRRWLVHWDPAFSMLTYLAEHNTDVVNEEQAAMVNIDTTSVFHFRLNEVQRAFTADRKPTEEFYDVLADPEQVHNLADDPAWAEELQRHRDLLKAWMLAIDDKARIQETPDDVRERTFIPYIVFPRAHERYDPSMLDTF